MIKKTLITLNLLLQENIIYTNNFIKYIINDCIDNSNILTIKSNKHICNIDSICISKELFDNCLNNKLNINNYNYNLSNITFYSQVLKLDECDDKNIHCKSWSEKGECNINSQYMLNNCRKSCNIC